MVLASYFTTVSATILSSGSTRNYAPADSELFAGSGGNYWLHYSIDGRQDEVRRPEKREQVYKNSS
jgi:hypothetical protein